MWILRGRGGLLRSGLGFGEGSCMLHVVRVVWLRSEIVARIDELQWIWTMHCILDLFMWSAFTPIIHGHESPLISRYGINA